MRKIELAEVQRLEADAKRRALEKERRVEQELSRAAERKLLEEKVAAQYFSQQYLGSLHSGVFDMLEDQGFFYDPLQKEIEEITMIELIGSLRARSDLYEAAQMIADELIAGARLKAKEFEERAIAFRTELAERKIREDVLASEKKAEELRLIAEQLAKEEAAGDDADNPDTDN